METNEQEIRVAAQVSRKKSTFNEDGKSENTGLEPQVFDRAMSLHEQEPSVSTAEVIDFAAHL